jgi:hypothetical protein
MQCCNVFHPTVLSLYHSMLKGWPFKYLEEGLKIEMQEVIHGDV